MKQLVLKLLKKTTCAVAGTTSKPEHPDGANCYRLWQAMSQENLLMSMKSFYSYLVVERIENCWPVTQKAFDALSTEDVTLIEKGVANAFGQESLAALMRWREVSLPHYRREILRYGCSVEPALLREKTRMTSANPPPSVHSMMRSEIFAGDLYSGDMIVSALERAGISFNAGGCYLDFGCSSGALTRNLLAHFPEGRWHGCDPVAASVEWASEHFPQIEFYVNEQRPPLKYTDGLFHGVYAVSIWSHFSEQAAIDWFDEMRRIIVPGGFLVITTHGIRSLYYYLSNNLMPLETISHLLQTVAERQYAFQPVWDNNTKEIDYLDTSDWGNAYFTLEWVANYLAPHWSVFDYVPGINQMNQDIYVLRRN